MPALIISKLYLFEPNEQVAKYIEFSPTSNVLTSNVKDGNSVGKSTIIKSIYHGMGADCKFATDWPIKDIITIVCFSINEKQYKIYRHNRLFRLFSGDELIAEVSNRKELAEEFEEIFGFSVKLPNKSNDHLEIAPPAFLFALNYLDHASGSNFSSFDRLYEYSDVKETVIYSHLGAFNERYYSLLKDLESVKDLKTKTEETQNLLNGMIERIKSEIADIDYSADLDRLRAETEAYARAYNLIALDLAKLKNKIISESNERLDIQHQIADLKGAFQKLQKGIETANVSHKCPICSTELEDLTMIRARGYNEKESIILMCDELSKLLEDLNRSIESNHQAYRSKLDELNGYKERLSFTNKMSSDIIAQEGAIKLRDQLISEADEAYLAYLRYSQNIKDLRKALKLYDDKKTEINADYYDAMRADRDKFMLREITDDSIRNIKNVFRTTEGSNDKLSSIVWHMNLLKLKTTFNESALRFPLIIDSPTGDEVDNQKKRAIWKYIIGRRPEGCQLICSALGFTTSMQSQLGIDRVIRITSSKYKLLNHEDYAEHFHTLEALSIVNIDE